MSKLTKNNVGKLLAVSAMICPAIMQAQTVQADKKVARERGVKPRNVIFILSDDHRYDFMGFTGAVPWLQTPNLDFMAQNGAYIQNAFVTTSLSSPSRASILTGMFSHEHTVVDNVAPCPEGLVFFPAYLHQRGYQTAFFGKWHMGNSGDEPQPGFDHWEAYKGQGEYYAPQLNINGERVKYGKEVYSPSLLTDHTIDFIDETTEKGRPFFVYLSHKSVHSPCQATPKRKGMYDDEEIPYPESFNVSNVKIPQLSTKNEKGKALEDRDWYGENRVPDWVKNTRESWHGADYPYNGQHSFEQEYKMYCETLTSLDDEIGRLFDYLREKGLDRNTLIIYMGDNGFIWGEHGLIDKRNFYEESVRVPMLAYCPEIIRPGTVVEEMVQNIDIAPTVLAAAGLKKASQMRGASFLPLLEGKDVEDWRHRIYYEYYWEYDFPQNPTCFGVRTDKYKYIRYHGIWDTNEFYDLENDPHEMHNLIDAPEHQNTIKGLANYLYDWLDETGGMQIPLKKTVKTRFGDHRNKGTL